MLSLIIIILAAFGLALFAMQNTETAPLALGSYVFADVPIYFIVIGSMLVGVLLAALIHSFGMVTGYMELRRQHKVNVYDKQRISELVERNKELEQEIANLRDETHEEQVEEQREEPHTQQSSFMETVRGKFTPAHS